MIIDAHLHVWSLDAEKYPWNPIGGYIPEKSASVEEYKRQMDDAGVDKAVLVQPTPYGWDNSYLMDARRQDRDRFRAVVLVDPSAEDSAEKLSGLIEAEADGLRINLHLLAEGYAEKESFWNLLQAAADVGIPVCFQLTPDHFNLVQVAAERFPQTKFVLDHLAKPFTGSSATTPLFAQFLGLAKFKNVYVKLSGLNYYSIQPYPYKDTWPLLKAACKRFTAERCMWGSDFPFVNHHWSYTGFLETMQYDLEFTQNQLSWILAGTAASLWWAKEKGD